MSQSVDVVIPTIGESVSEGTIGKWYFKEGDSVQKDQPLFELDSDKATLEVPASASGKLSKILIPAGKVASVGAKVAVIEMMEGAATDKSASTPKKEVQVPEPQKAPASPSAATPIAAQAIDLKGYSPSKRKAIREGTLSPSSTPSASIFGDDSGREIRKPMTTLRKRIAERLLESQQTTATLTTFNEIDMSRAMDVRKKLKDSFEKQYGVKLGFMSFFSKAVIHALNAFPDVNARIEGDDLVYPDYVNLGIAVSTERGLVVPVLRDAQQMTYAQIEAKIAELAEKARAGKLQIPEMQGGTFTLTNGGVFGSLLSTPIINPPQSGILGMHKIEHRPMAIDKGGKFEVEVRPMMYVALSYDHRIIDGATSVGFLVKVKEYMEAVTEDLVRS